MKLNTFLKLTAICGILAVSASASYHFVIFIPKQARLKSAGKTLDKIELQACLGRAFKKTHSLNSGRRLTKKLINKIQSLYKKDAGYCFKKHPLK